MGPFEMVILKKKLHQESTLFFFTVKSKENGKTSKISLSKDIIDLKAQKKHCVSVLKPYLFVHACLLIELHQSLFFSLQNSGFHIGGATYLWVLLVHGLLQYCYSKLDRMQAFTLTNIHSNITIAEVMYSFFSRTKRKKQSTKQKR